MKTLKSFAFKSRISSQEPNYLHSIEMFPQNEYIQTDEAFTFEIQNII